MPKDEFDFDDPMELNGVGLACNEDTTEAMTECFIEEFMRLGYNHKQILALFRNPHYLGMNMALQNRGEPFVRDAIQQVFAQWGRPISWPATPNPVTVQPPFGSEASSGLTPDPHGPNADPSDALRGDEPESEDTDPMGAPVPKLKF